MEDYGSQDTQEGKKLSKSEYSSIEILLFRDWKQKEGTPFLSLFSFRFYHFNYSTKKDINQSWTWESTNMYEISTLGGHMPDTKYMVT